MECLGIKVYYNVTWQNKECSSLSLDYSVDHRVLVGLLSRMDLLIIWHGHGPSPIIGVEFHRVAVHKLHEASLTFVGQTRAMLQNRSILRPYAVKFVNFITISTVQSHKKYASIKKLQFRLYKNNLKTF